MCWRALVLLVVLLLDLAERLLRGHCRKAVFRLAVTVIHGEMELLFIYLETPSLHTARDRVVAIPHPFPCPRTPLLRPTALALAA